MPRVDNDEIVDARVLPDAVTVVGVFASGTAAREAARTLERAGFPPDRIGIVYGNVRQARELAGSYSPQGALVGAILGALLIVALVIFSGEVLRQNPLGPVLGGSVLIGAFAAIGWLSGRARVFKADEYGKFEEHAEHGDVLVSAVCNKESSTDLAQVILERAGATEIRVERSGEAV